MLHPRTLLRLFLVAAGLLCLPACSHYRLGTGSEAKFRTLYVEPVTNRTLLPQSRALVSTQLREALLRDGRVSLVNSAAEADAILTVAISEYRRDVRAAREDDTGLARKFDLTLVATCTLRARGGQAFFEHRVISAQRGAFTDSGQISAQRGAFTDSSQLQSEYQALPLLAEALAAKITHAALDVW